MFNQNQILDNTYQIISPLGQGGTSSVYLAYHLRLQKNVVVKQLRGTFSSDFLMRTEVDILKNLHHPQLPQVYDFLQIDGAVYTVIDFVDGYDLESYIKTGTKLNEQQLQRFLRQIAQVLDYLHSQHPPVIHSDIKPGNIIINQRGDAVLIDFNTSIGGNQGNLLGLTLPYASPEQVQLAQFAQCAQIPPFALDCRSDLYSLGATFYELICGIRPVYGQRPVPLHTMGLAAYSRNFLLLIDRLMEYDRNKRVSSAKKLVAAIDRLDGRYYAAIAMRSVSVLASAALVAGGLYSLIRGVKLEKHELFSEHYTAVTTLIEQGDFEGADERIDAVFADRKMQAYLQEEAMQAARLYHAKGDMYYYQGDDGNAAIYYRQAVDRCRKRAKEYPVYLRDAAIAYAQAGDISNAYSMLQRVQEKEASYDDLMLISLVLESRVGDVDLCYEMTRQFLSTCQDSELCLRAATAAASVARDLDETIHWLEIAHSHDGGKTIARRLAVAYGEKAMTVYNPSEKETCLTKAAALYEQLCASAYASDNDRIHYSVILRMQERYNDALAVLLSVPVDTSDNYRLLANLCFVYYEMGDTANAATYCSRATVAWQNYRAPDKASRDNEEIENLNEISLRLGLGGL